MDIQDHSCEILDGKEEEVIRNLRKGNPCYKMAKKLAELCASPSVLWKVELASNGLDI